MADILIKPCTEHDLSLLAVFNKQLIEDEQHDNPMNIDQLKERMMIFLESDYQAFFFIRDHQIVGYALLNLSHNPFYLRQFFILREHRRRGYGKESFLLLLDYLKADTVDLDVLSWNHTGKKFWSSLGFEERSICMRYIKDHQHDSSGG